MQTMYITDLSLHMCLVIPKFLNQPLWRRLMQPTSQILLAGKSRAPIASTPAMSPSFQERTTASHIPGTSLLHRMLDINHIVSSPTLSKPTYVRFQPRLLENNEDMTDETLEK